MEVPGSGELWWSCLKKTWLLAVGQCSNKVDGVHNLMPIILLSILVGKQKENVGGIGKEGRKKIVELVVMVG